MRTGRREWLGVVVSAVLSLTTIHGEGKRPMTLIDLMEIPRVIDPQLSPDGQAIVYQLNRADWTAGQRIGHLWLQRTGTSPAQLTFGESGEFSPRWSPNGKSILFISRRSDATDLQIYLLPADGGEPRALTHHPTSVSSPAWAPDGNVVYFLASEPKTPEERERERLKDDVFAFEENGKQRHLWKVVVATGAESRLTEGESSVLGYRVSRDGRRIALHRAPTALAGDAWRGEVWVIDAAAPDNVQVLTHNSVEESDAELSPDGSQLLFLAEANQQFEPYYASALFVMPATAGSTPRLLLPDFQYPIDRATWSPDGRSILAVVNLGVHSEIFQIDPATRTARALTDGRHSVQFWSLVPSARRMVFQLDEPTRYGDAWTLEVPGDRGDAQPVRVTSVYDFLDRDFRLPRQEKVEWKAADGTTIEGLLCYPVDYEAGRKYPLVVQMHGGPVDSDKFGAGSGLVNDYVPVLTAKGYAVLKPNYRGSAGYGNAFLRDVVGHYFRNMQLDVLAGVDALVRQGIADPDRLIAMGWSAGGHLTNKLITITDRFKAASSGAGAADWTSMYAQTDTRVSRNAWFGGTPWQKDAPIDVYWGASPLKDAAAAKTPTLFIVGENDPRVPMPQSVEMFRALRSNGVPSRLYVAPREGHQWVELRHQLFKMNAELEWFERHAMGRDYVWEKAPTPPLAFPGVM